MIILLLFGVLAEAGTVAAVVPVVTAMSDPGKVMALPAIQPVIRLLDIQSGESLRRSLCLLFLLFVLTSSGIRLLYLWYSLRLSFAIGSDYAEMAYRRTLHLPYEDQTKLSSSYFLTVLAVKMQSIVVVGLVPILATFGAAILALAIATTLFLLSPEITTILAGVVVLIFVLMIALFRIPLRRVGEAIASIQPVFIEKLQIARGGIREIILDNTQDYFINELTRTERALRKHQIVNGFFVSSPRYFMELIFIIVLVGLSYRLFVETPDTSAVLPILSIIAIGVLKILPSAQIILLNWATVRSALPGISDALALFEEDVPEQDRRPVTAPLPFQRNIVLRDVWYRYGPEDPWILKGIDLEIRRGERVGIIGPTGAGKSTLIDLIMGLLPPTKGTASIDDIPLDQQTRKAWGKRIAHVPQSIYLTDASVAENIAFGVPKDRISASEVVASAKKADIASFVEDGASGFATLVGERGGRISGGQRQRIGIARALYKHADVIVLDEATSALDSATEERIMATILAFGRDTTIIMIAHRLTTLKACDRIVELDFGQIKRICAYGDI